MLAVRMFLSMSSRTPHPPHVFLFVFSFAQKVAAGRSSAFSKACGISSILKSLEEHGMPKASDKPQAKKRRFMSAKAKAKAKAKAQPTAKKTGPSPPPLGVVLVDSSDDEPLVKAAPAVEPKAAPAVEPAAKALKDTRHCVTSRAYKRARTQAKNSGKSSDEIVEAAKKAFREAGEKWDQEHK